MKTIRSGIIEDEDINVYRMNKKSYRKIIDDKP